MRNQNNEKFESQRIWDYPTLSKRNRGNLLTFKYIKGMKNIHQLSSFTDITKMGLISETRHMENFLITKKGSSICF